MAKHNMKETMEAYRTPTGGKMFVLDATSKPTDGTSGYGVMCWLLDTTNKVAYLNEGSESSCDFNAVTTS